MFDQVVAFGASTAKSRVSPGLMARRSCSRRTHKLHGEGGEGAATVSNMSHPPPRAASTGNPTHQSTCQRLLPKLTTTESDVSSRPALHPAVRSPHQSLRSLARPSTRRDARDSPLHTISSAPLRLPSSRPLAGMSSLVLVVVVLPESMPAGRVARLSTEQRMQHVSPPQTW